MTFSDHLPEAVLSDFCTVELLFQVSPFQTRGKVSLRRINLEGNTHVQESNVSQLSV
jgi:hypothetical protein